MCQTRLSFRDNRGSNFLTGSALSLSYAAGYLLLFRKRMRQISYWKQRETKNSAPEIEVMTNAMLVAPMHPRK